MYGRNGDGYMRGRGGGPGYGAYDYVEDVYRCPPEPWIAPYDGPDRGSSYYDRPERSRYDYPEPELGYRGPPRPKRSWKRGRPRGNFRGNFVPTPPISRPKKQKFTESKDVHKTEMFINDFFYGGGFIVKKNSWKKIGLQSKISEDNGPPAAKKIKTAENTGNAEEVVQITASDGEGEGGTKEETEHTPSSSKEPKEEIDEETLVNKIQLYCPLCKFRTFYEEDWNTHEQSDFHKEHLRFVKLKFHGNKANFIEAFLEDELKQARQQREQIEDLGTKISLINRNRDLTLGLDIKQFMKKMSVAHCATCNTFIPLDPIVLQSHIESSAHTQKLLFMKKGSKREAFKTAWQILRNSSIGTKIEPNRKGRKPFINAVEKNKRSGSSGDLAPEVKESAEMPCITLSDSEGEEDEDFQDQNAFINHEEKDDTRHDNNA